MKYLLGQFASVAFFVLLRPFSTLNASHSIYCLTVTEAVEMKCSCDADELCRATRRK